MTDELDKLIEERAELVGQLAYLRARGYARPSRPTSAKYLYFIACGDAVKVGVSSDPENRMKELRAGAPGPLRIVAKFEQRGRDEGALHKRIAHLRLYGEWFRHTEEVDALIRELSE